MGNDLAFAAEVYALAGLPVVPVHSIRDGMCSCGDRKCRSPGKHPRTARGSKDATVDIEQVRAWWRQWPDANVGIATGGSIFVADVDPRNGGDQSLGALIDTNGPLSCNLMAITNAGGFHLYFSIPPEVRIGQCKLAQGIDIKGEGGIVLAPPSQGVKGPYRWLEDHPFLEQRPGKGSDWVVELILEKTQHAASPGSRKRKQRSDDQEAPFAQSLSVDELRVSDEIKQLIREGVPYGKRSDALFAVTAEMHASGYDAPTIASVLFDDRNGISDKPRQQGPEWTLEDVNRVLAKLQTDDTDEDTMDASTEQAGPAPRTYLTAREIMELELPPIRWSIPGILPEGVTILAAPPKTGKSWLIMACALAIGEGSSALGRISCPRGTALMLALEDSSRRLQDRLASLLADENGNPRQAPDNVIFYTKWLPLDKGGREMLEQTLEQNPEVVLLVIDTLARIRGRARSNDVYLEDYKTIQQLHELALRFRVAIVVVHHLRKTQKKDDDSGGDSLEEVSGSMGLTAAADCVWVLKRKRATPYGTLMITGRDVEERTLSLRWDEKTARWSIADKADDFQMSRERRAIVEVLASSDGPLSPKEVAAALGKDANTIKQLMWKMLLDGQIVRVGRGRYAVPGTPDNR